MLSNELRDRYLETDIYEGLQNAVDSTRPEMGMFYVNEIINDLKARIDQLEADARLAESRKVTKQPAPAKPKTAEADSDS